MSNLFHLSSRCKSVASGLKSRIILAWGKAPGTQPVTSRGLKARAKCLIPHKPLIELHPIFRKHHAHLGLEISPLVVRGLRIDVLNQCRPITQADRKNRIAPLPAELRELRALRLDPLGRRNLQSL